MSVMKRLTSIVQAKTNKVLDKVEDPRDTLDLSYEKQLEQLQQVRKGVADVAMSRQDNAHGPQEFQKVAGFAQVAHGAFADHNPCILSFRQRTHDQDTRMRMPAGHISQNVDAVAAWHVDIQQ